MANERACYDDIFRELLRFIDQNIGAAGRKSLISNHPQLSRAYPNFVGERHRLRGIAYILVKYSALFPLRGIEGEFAPLPQIKLPSSRLFDWRPMVERVHLVTASFVRHHLRNTKLTFILKVV